MDVLDLKGKKFSRLLVLKQGLNKHNRVSWDCKCDCGKLVPSVLSNSLMMGNTRSCGCIAREILLSRNMGHGKTHTPLYKRYHAIRNRCTNSRTPSYYLYGGRGIKLLWKSFAEFEKDMGEEFYRLRKENPRISIERIDNNGNYCKENCRWATDFDQANNTRRNHFLTFKGKTQTLTQWAREVGSNQERIRHRLVLGFTVEEALTFNRNQYRQP